VTTPLEIPGLSRVDARYEVLFCDIWGVIHNGRESFPAACSALTQWRETRGPVILISNSPRPSAEVIRQLAQLGAPRSSWTEIVTSGDVTRAMLAERAPGPAFRIGPERDDPLYDGLGLAFADLERAAFIACTGPDDDEVETPEDYRAVLTAAAVRKLDMICANPDRVVQRGDRLIYCGGALAELYETLGGRTIMAGKPHAPIYDRAFELAANVLGRPAERRAVLVIGDGVKTDIGGAQSQNLDRLFILTGIHAAEAADAEALLADAGLTAQYVMSDLTW